MQSGPIKLSPGRWFSQSTAVSSTEKTDCHDITKILLREALNTKLSHPPFSSLLMKFCSVIFFFRCDDYLKLFLYLERPEVNENSKDDVVLCGNISNLQQKTFYSKSRSLIMEFHTTVPHRDQLLYYKGYSGFRGLFRFKDESKSCANLIIAIIVDPLIVYPCFN